MAGAGRLARPFPTPRPLLPPFLVPGPSGFPGRLEGPFLLPGPERVFPSFPSPMAEYRSTVSGAAS